MARSVIKIGRNDLCLCGSNLKYKKCCLNQGSFSKESLDDIKIREIGEGQKKKLRKIFGDEIEVSSPNFMVHPSRSVMGCNELSQSWHFKSLTNTVFDVKKSVNS